MTSVKNKQFKASKANAAVVTAIMLLAVYSLFKHQIVVREAVQSAMINAFSKIIPSLFPFMVISTVISSREMIRPIAKLLSRATYRVLGLNEHSTEVIILGIISGYPIGACLTCAKYSDGAMNSTNAEVTLALSHNTGPAFPVGFIGIMLWGNIRFGWLLYISQIIFSYLLVSLFIRSSSAVSESVSVSSLTEQKASIFQSFVDAVTSSTASCVKLTGFVVVFKIIGQLIINSMKIESPIAAALIYSVLEFSEGCCAAKRVGGVIGMTVTGFSLGFGGVSALMQAASYAEHSGIRMKKCVLVKVLQGIFCAVTAFLFAILQKRS